MNILLDNKFHRKLTFLIKHIRRFLLPTKAIKVFGPNNGSIEAIYIVNLDRQPARWKQITKELKHQKVSGGGTLADFAQRIIATDGKQLKIDAVQPELIDKEFNIKDQYYVDPDPQILTAIRDRDIWIDMSPEEIAVALSHINCWKKIIGEKRSYGMILEDDIFFESSFSNNVNALWKELPGNEARLPDFDLLYLSYKEVDRGAEKVKFSDHLIKPVKGFWWLSGYVLTYSGAQKLLEMLPVKGPVDLWMNLQFTKLNVYASASSLIYQRNDLKSNNNYSVLPILSQIGIQSDKTHLELQQSKGRNPVFVIAHNIDQASTIETALSILGYRCCFDRWGSLSTKIQEFITAKEPLLFDAYICLNYLADNYKTLELLYPNAVFLLLKTSDKTGYVQEVTEHFKHNRKNLMVINMEKERKWDALCKYLNCKIPPFSFPPILSVPDYKIIPQIEKTTFAHNITYQQHDVTPWIIPMERLSAFGIPASANRTGQKVGYFESELEDNFTTFNEDQWDILESTFPSNLAEFTKDNFKLESTGFNLTLTNKKSKLRAYTSASIASKQAYSYGRFEVIMRPAKLHGIITAFFLHRNDPWQELDFEFLGRDTSKVLLNVYFNPGSNGSGWNFGNRGTPVIIDLGFDASIDFHKYAIEWEPHQIRWFVDDTLIHTRNIWEPTPIPNLPMNLFINLWPSASEELAGVFTDTNLPVQAYVKTVSVSSWSTS